MSTPLRRGAKYLGTVGVIQFGHELDFLAILGPRNICCKHQLFSVKGEKSPRLRHSPYPLGKHVLLQAPRQSTHLELPVHHRTKTSFSWSAPILGHGHRRPQHQSVACLLPSGSPSGTGTGGSSTCSLLCQLQCIETKLWHLHKQQHNFEVLNAPKCVDVKSPKFMLMCLLSHSWIKLVCLLI